MKALVLQEFGTMVVAERPDPTPGPDEVVIAMVATGICGSDLHGYTGETGRRSPGQVMGHESVGRIAAVGDRVDDPALAPGTPVTFNPVVIPVDAAETFRDREQLCPDKYVIGVAPEVSASFAQLMVAPARNVVPLPETMPITYGALVEPLAVAVHAVRRAGVRPEHRVLVVGGGPIGQSVVLALQMIGVDTIVVSEVSAVRRELITRLGATVVDATAEGADTTIVEALGGPADVAIDAVGIDLTLATCVAATALGAVICLVGMGSRRIELDAYAISTGERSLVGSFTYTARDFADAAAWMGRAPEQAAELISREVPLSDGPRAFADLIAGDPTPGKVLVRLDR